MEEFFPGKIGEFHAVYDKEEQGFLCRMGSRNHNLEVFDAGEIVEHLKDEHNVDPKDQIIKGWTNKFEQQAKKYLDLLHNSE